MRNPKLPSFNGVGGSFRQRTMGLNPSQLPDVQVPVTRASAGPGPGGARCQGRSVIVPPPGRLVHPRPHEKNTSRLLGSALPCCCRLQQHGDRSAASPAGCIPGISPLTGNSARANPPTRRVEGLPARQPAGSVWRRGAVIEYEKDSSTHMAKPCCVPWSYRPSSSHGPVIATVNPGDCRFANSQRPSGLKVAPHHSFLRKSPWKDL